MRNARNRKGPRSQKNIPIVGYYCFDTQLSNVFFIRFQKNRKSQKELNMKQNTGLIHRGERVYVNSLPNPVFNLLFPSKYFTVKLWKTCTFPESGCWMTKTLLKYKFCWNETKALLYSNCYRFHYDLVSKERFNVQHCFPILACLFLPERKVHCCVITWASTRRRCFSQH